MIPYNSYSLVRVVIKKLTRTKKRPTELTLELTQETKKAYIETLIEEKINSPEFRNSLRQFTECWVELIRLYEDGNWKVPEVQQIYLDIAKTTNSDLSNVLLTRDLIEEDPFITPEEIKKLLISGLKIKFESLILKELGNY